MRSVAALVGHGAEGGGVVAPGVKGRHEVPLTTQSQQALKTKKFHKSKTMMIMLLLLVWATKLLIIIDRWVTAQSFEFLPEPLTIHNPLCTDAIRCFLYATLVNMFPSKTQMGMNRLQRYAM